MSDDFDLFGDTKPTKEDKDKEKSAKSKNSKLYKGLGAAAVVVAVAAGGYIMTNDEPEPVPPPKPVAADVPLVNAEQRDWAGLVCNGSNYWNGKMVPVSNSEGAVSPQKARASLKKTLNKNSATANKYAESVRNYPERALKSASSNQAVPSVTVLEKKVGEEPDPRVVELSQELASAISTYANDMAEASVTLSTPSNYDGAGIREAISNASSDVADSTERFRTSLDTALKSDIFDNVTTLNIASSIPACANTFMHSDQRESLRSDIDDEATIRSSAILDRCEEHVEHARKAFGESGKAEVSKGAPAIEKQRVSVFNNDVDRCVSIIADPGFDVDSPVIKHGVNPIPSTAVSNELPDSAKAAEEEKSAPSSSSEKPSETASPQKKPKGGE